MNPQQSGPGETARQWAIHVQDPAFSDWAGFTAWLESDPAHAAAYDRALDEAEWAASLLAMAPAAANDRAIEPAVDLPPRRRWLPLTIAAAVALAGGWVLSQRAGMEVIETGAGEHRAIALADGSRIILNGSTRISFDPDEPRHVELAAGEALFEVRHDERDPFVVMAGDTRLVDIGTVFNVVREDGVLDLAVSHGAVVYRPGHEAIRVDAGEGLSRAGRDARPVKRKVDPLAVGSWRAHLLRFDNAPLDQVARDLARTVGAPIRAGDGTQGLRFTGTLATDGTPEQVFARVGPLLGVRFAAEGDSWSMTPDHGSTP